MALQFYGAFTQNWVGNLLPSLNILYPAPPTAPMKCVEVGSFEGLGSLVITKLLCSAEGSQLICIDPLDDGYVRGNAAMAVFDDQYVGQFARFSRNTAGVAAISLRRGTSTDQIPGIEEPPLILPTSTATTRRAKCSPTPPSCFQS